MCKLIQFGPTELMVFEDTDCKLQMSVSLFVPYLLLNHWTDFDETWSLGVKWMQEGHRLGFVDLRGHRHIVTVVVLDCGGKKNRKISPVTAGLWIRVLPCFKVAPIALLRGLT